jgi:hypothetical protein
VPLLRREGAGLMPFALMPADPRDPPYPREDAMARTRRDRHEPEPEMCDHGGAVHDFCEDCMAECESDDEREESA